MRNYWYPHKNQPKYLSLYAAIYRHKHKLRACNLSWTNNYLCKKTCKLVILKTQLLSVVNVPRLRILLKSIFYLLDKSWVTAIGSQQDVAVGDKTENSPDDSDNDEEAFTLNGDIDGDKHPDSDQYNW